MNEITLKGILKDIEYSHTLNDIEYHKANLIVPRDDGEDDIIALKFKKYSNVYQENQLVSLKGNIRSYSRRLSDGKTKVDIYVFTYFDIPSTDENDFEIINHFNIDGRICKTDKIRQDRSGKDNYHFILANNIFTESRQSKIDTYLPCVCFGTLAKELSTLPVGSQLKLSGSLHSRIYKKFLDNDELELRLAREAVITNYEEQN